MFDRFTERARKVMTLARQRAVELGHDYIGTEHFLLSLVQEGSGVAAQVLKNLDVDLRKVRAEVERLVGQGTKPVSGSQLPFTPRAKRVLEFALEESQEFGHDRIGTEHLLLGLMREKDGPAAHVLENLEVKAARVREEVVTLLRAGSLDDPPGPAAVAGAPVPQYEEPPETSAEGPSGPAAQLQQFLRERLLASPPPGLPAEEIDLEVQRCESHKGMGFQLLLGRLKPDGSLGTEMSVWVEKAAHVAEAFPGILQTFATLVWAEECGDPEAAAGESSNK